MTFLEKLRCLMTFGQGVTLSLPEISADSDPLILFNQWFEDAQKSGVLLPEGMSVSSCTEHGQPRSRMVLLKQFDAAGFVFYTNYASSKSDELEQNNKVALLFHWNVLQRQIRIEGTVEKISPEQSAAYFHSRDRGSQIGAWASKQSKKITSEDELSSRFSKFKKKFGQQQEIPYPEFWGGWRVKPHAIEFWQGRSSRLHDRICFEKSAQDAPWQHFKRHP
jgi:pyridoxamine 5'-phosphate oxidase